MPPARARICLPLAVYLGPAGSAGVEIPDAFRVDRLVEENSSEKISSSSEYVYLSFLPRVRPSYSENPGSGRAKAALRAMR